MIKTCHKNFIEHLIQVPMLSSLYSNFDQNLEASATASPDATEIQQQRKNVTDSFYPMVDDM